MKKTCLWAVLVGLLAAVLTVISVVAAPRNLETKAQFNDTDKYWVSAKEIAYKSIADLLVQRQSELQRGLYGSKLMHGDLGTRDIAITFDDGPHPKYTPQILAILKQFDVKATFFVVGEMAEKYPKLVKAEVAAGNSVGNHTYHHVNLTQIPPVYVATELKACGEVLDRILGRPPHLFRPPGGDYNDQVARVAEALGYHTILWTNDPGDYSSPGTRMIETRTIDKVSNGGIVLIHDGIQQTIEALPHIIRYLRDRGYKLVTIDQMLADAPKSQARVSKTPWSPTVRQVSIRNGSKD